MTTLQETIAHLKDLDAKRTQGSWVAQDDELYTEYPCRHCPPGSANTDTDFIINEMAGCNPDDIAFFEASPAMMGVIKELLFRLEICRDQMTGWYDATDLTISCEPRA